MIIEHTRVSFLAFPLLLSHSIFKLQSSLRTNIIQEYLKKKMALMVNAASLLGVGQHPFPSLGLTSSSPRIPSSNSFKSPILIHGTKTRAVFPPVFALKNRYDSESEVAVDIVVEDEEDEAVTEKPRTETLLYSFTPLPLLFVAALPGAGAVRSVFGPFVEIVKSFNLPDWLVHWGHPGNMAVVLFAMGGYGTYLGFRIRFSDDVEERAKAKDLHPKLLAGMFFFFALGATGGITSLLTSDKPILESPHAVTGLIGLALLTVQTLLPALFEGNPGLRNVHGILGSGIMTLFLVHFALGLQLGLSY